MRKLKLLAVIFLFSFTLIFPQKEKTYYVETLTETPFDASGGIAVSEDGTVYVADFGIRLNFANGMRVHKVNKDGTVETFANNLEGASGNDFDSKGNLFQSNIAGNYLSKISPDGTVETFASGNIIGPVGVAVAPGDTVYVANCGNNRIMKVTPDGVSTVFVSSNLLQCPNGLTIDNDGNLYTCNFGNGNIIKITPQKEVSVLATLPGGRCGHLTFANGVLYAVARCANKIYEVTLDGNTSLVAGSGLRGNEDGVDTLASFNLPNGIRSSPDGDTLYVNDAVSLDGDCTSTPLNPVIVRMILLNPSTSAEEDRTNVPDEFKLYQNYPNPFNPSTKIKYDLAEDSRVKLKIYNTLGQEIKTLVNEYQIPGTKTVSWDSTNNSGQKVSSGIYFYNLTIDTKTFSKKMVLLQ